MDRIASPATRVITKCGKGSFSHGLALVGQWTGVHESRLYRWTYDRARGGTGGLIPTQHQQTILTRAQLAGIPLAPEDFFFTPAELAPPPFAAIAGGAR
ncbi:MAG TPA: hypothetical protein VGF56_05910 [Rhizomicrobium sp.]|jgi:hypothetical protein